MHSRILILDKESFFAEMLQEAVLEHFTDCTVHVETSDVTGLEKIIHENFRRVIISLDLFEAMEDSIIGELTSLYQDLTLVLNMPAMDLRRMRRARRQGIKAFITRNSDMEEVMLALQNSALNRSNGEWPTLSGEVQGSSPSFVIEPASIVPQTP